MKASHFIVAYQSDLGGMTVPYGWDDDCLGAICSYSDSIALFTSRKLAQQAIRISARFAALRSAQGKPANTDFIADIKNVRIIPCSSEPLPPK